MILVVTAASTVDSQEVVSTGLALWCVDLTRARAKAREKMSEGPRAKGMSTGAL